MAVCFLALWILGIVVGLNFGCVAATHLLRSTTKKSIPNSHSILQRHRQREPPHKAWRFERACQSRSKTHCINSYTHGLPGELIVQHPGHRFGLVCVLCSPPLINSHISTLSWIDIYAARIRRCHHLYLDLFQHFHEYTMLLSSMLHAHT